jgi:hypothetical protein
MVDEIAGAESDSQQVHHIEIGVVPGDRIMEHG